jgi:hypothetical protein
MRFEVPMAVSILERYLHVSYRFLIMQKGAQKPRRDEKHLLKVLNIAIQNAI